MNRFFILTVFFIGIFSALSMVEEEVYAQGGEKFIIEVTSPKPNSKVGRETIVKGTAIIPGGHYLWVLARRKDFKPLWWPQREAEIDPRTHKWSASAFFGEARDIGWEFDIGVITVNEKGHAKLRDYWIKAMKTGDWRPIEIPETSSPPRIWRVKKVSH